ncbi:MAG: hypothetical protein AAF666_06055 [Pseudomonadota bacterium]
MKHLLLIALALTATGCAAHVQSTSGAEYLARSTSPVAGSEILTRRYTDRDGAERVEEIEIPSTDQLVRKAASIEPTLTLPARIGLARIEHGQLTAIPPHEGAIWSQLAGQHRSLGVLVPVDPFLANYTVRSILPQDRQQLRSDSGDLLTKIRLGAARQHMDAVLIYEVGTANARGKGPGGLGHVQVLGGLPSNSAVNTDLGIGRALLLDVRNGYPYGVATAHADLGNIETSFWDEEADLVAYSAATERLVTVLEVEVSKIFAGVTQAAAIRVAQK